MEVFPFHFPLPSCVTGVTGVAHVTGVAGPTGVVHVAGVTGPKGGADVASVLFFFFGASELS